MAQKVHVVLEDDIDGGEAAETVVFGLDGVNYEIDLSEGNAARMRDALAPYVGVARRVGGRTSAGRGRGTGRARGSSGGSSGGGGGRGSTAQVREWARENGFEVSDRGRVPTSVLEAYEKAHS